MSIGMIRIVRPIGTLLVERFPLVSLFRALAAGPGDEEMSEDRLRVAMGMLVLTMLCLDDDGAALWSRRHQQPEKTVQCLIALLHAHTTPCAQGGHWIDEGAAASGSLYDCLLLRCMTAEIGTLRRYFMHHPSSSDHTKMKLRFAAHLRRVGYGILKKATSESALVSQAARETLRVMSDAHRELHPAKPRGVLSAAADAVAFELSATGSLGPRFDEYWDPAPCRVLLACLAAAPTSQDHAVLRMADIVSSLSQRLRLGLGVVRSTCPPPAYASESITWTTRCLAAVARRLSGTILAQQKIRRDQYAAALKEAEDDENRATVSATIRQLYTDATALLGYARNASSWRDGRVTDKQRLAAVEVPIPCPTFLGMAETILDACRTLLLYSRPDIELLAHIACLYAMHCFSVSRSAFLPKIHQLWPSLVCSLSRQTQPAFTTTLTAALTVRFILSLAPDFVISRFTETLFPAIALYLESHPPCRRADVSDRPTVLRTQLVLFDILVTAAAEPGTLKQTCTRCFALAYRFTDARAAPPLTQSAQTLTALCFRDGFDRCLLHLVALASLIVNDLPLGDANATTLRSLLSTAFGAPALKEDQALRLLQMESHLSESWLRGTSKALCHATKKGVNLNIFEEDHTPAPPQAVLVSTGTEEGFPVWEQLQHHVAPTRQFLRDICQTNVPNGFCTPIGPASSLFLPSAVLPLPSPVS